MFNNQAQQDRATLMLALQAFAKTTAVKDEHEYNLLNSLIKSLSY